MRNRIINSTLYLFSAYFFVHFLRLISQYLVLQILNLEKLVMYFFYNSYEMPIVTWWTRIKVLLISGIATLTTAIIIAIFLILFLNLSRKKYKLNVLFNWVLLVAVSFLLADFISAPFFREESQMFTVLRWLNFEDGGGGMYAIAILMLPLIPIIGYSTHKPFLSLTNTTKWLKTRKERMKFYSKVTFIPFFILTIVISIMVYFIFNYPLMNVLSNEGMRLTIIASVLFFGIFFSNNKKYISIQKSNTLHLLNKSVLMFIIVFLLSIYILLWFNLS